MARESATGPRVPGTMGYTAGEFSSADRHDEASRRGAARRRGARAARRRLAVWARGGRPRTMSTSTCVKSMPSALRSLVAADHAPSGRPRAGCSRRTTTRSWSTSSSAPPAGRSATSTSTRELLEVMAQPVLVASLDDVLAMKLLSLREQELDYGPVLELSRSLREQVDWDFVREQADVSVRARVLRSWRSWGSLRPRRLAAFRRAAYRRWASNAQPQHSRRT